MPEKKEADSVRDWLGLVCEQEATVFMCCAVISLLFLFPEITYISIF